MYKVQNSVPENPKYFWKYINNKRSNFSYPLAMSHNEKKNTGGNEIVNFFSQYFSCVFSPSVNTPPSSASNRSHLIDFNSWSVSYKISLMNLIILSTKLILVLIIYPVYFSMQICLSCSITFFIKFITSIRYLSWPMEIKLRFTNF